MEDEKDTLETEETVSEEKATEQQTAESSEQETTAEDKAKPAAKEQSKQDTAEDEALSVQLMRLRADFTNFRRRAEKEKSDIHRLANEKLLTELLPVLDNMDRAMSHSDEENSKAFVDGVEMVFKNLLQVLANAGLKEIEAEGKEFDHNLHHAVITEACDGVECNKVLQVLQKGYTLNDKVIRPAMVKVSE